jgi:hypothetical protein
MATLKILSGLLLASFVSLMVINAGNQAESKPQADKKPCSGTL